MAPRTKASDATADADNTMAEGAATTTMKTVLLLSPLAAAAPDAQPTGGARHVALASPLASQPAGRGRRRLAAQTIINVIGDSKCGQVTMDKSYISNAVSFAKGKG